MIKSIIKSIESNIIIRGKIQKSMECNIIIGGKNHYKGGNHYKRGKNLIEWCKESIYVTHYYNTDLYNYYYLFLYLRII